MQRYLPKLLLVAAILVTSGFIGWKTTASIQGYNHLIAFINKHKAALKDNPDLLNQNSSSQTLNHNNLNNNLNHQFAKIKPNSKLKQASTQQSILNQSAPTRQFQQLNQLSSSSQQQLSPRNDAFGDNLGHGYTYTDYTSWRPSAVYDYNNDKVWMGGWSNGSSSFLNQLSIYDGATKSLVHNGSNISGSYSAGMWFHPNADTMWVGQENGLSILNASTYGIIAEYNASSYSWLYPMSMYQYDSFAGVWYTYEHGYSTGTPKSPTIYALNGNDDINSVTINSTYNITSNHIIRRMAFSSQYIFVATCDDGIFIYNRNDLSTVAAHLWSGQEVFGFAINADGTKGVGVINGTHRPTKFDFSNMAQITSSEISNALSDTFWYVFYEPERNEFLVSSSNNGVLFINGDSMTMAEFLRVSPVQYAEAITTGPNNEVWFALGNGFGVYKVPALSHVVTVDPNTIPASEQTIDGTLTKNVTANPVDLTFTFNVTSSLYFGQILKIYYSYDKNLPLSSWSLKTASLDALATNVTVNLTQQTSLPGSKRTVYFKYAVSPQPTTTDSSWDVDFDLNSSSSWITDLGDHTFSYNYYYDANAPAHFFEILNTINPYEASPTAESDNYAVYNDYVRLVVNDTAVTNVQIDSDPLIPVTAGELTHDITTWGKHTVTLLDNNNAILETDKIWLKNTIEQTTFTTLSGTSTIQSALEYDTGTSTVNTYQAVITGYPVITVTSSDHLYTYAESYYEPIDPNTLASTGPQTFFTSASQDIHDTASQVYKVHLAGPADTGVGSDYYLYLDNSYPQLSAPLTDLLNKLQISYPLTIGSDIRTRLSSYASSLDDDLTTAYENAQAAAVGNTAVNLGYTFTVNDVTWTYDRYRYILSNTWAGETAPANPNDYINITQSEFDAAALNYAKTLLNADIAAAESAAVKRGYSVTQLLGTISRPTTKAEIDNFNSSGKTYQQWLTDEATTKFNSALSDAVAAATLLGYSENDILTFGSATTPTTLDELNNFNSSGQSYTAWLTAKAAEKLAIDTNTAEAGATLRGYTVDYILNDFGLVKPKSLTELNNFDGLGTSYQDWLSAKSLEILNHETTLAESQAATLGYTVTAILNGLDKPATASEINNFNSSGKTYEQWLTVEAAAKLAADIAAAEAAATLYGYTATDILNSQSRNQPVSKDQLDNFDGTNSYQAWLTIKAGALFNYNLNQAETQATKLGYTVTDILGGLDKPATKSELDDFMGSGKTYQKWLTDEAAIKLDTDTTAAEAAATLNGYTVTDLLDRYGKQKPKTKTSLDDFDGGQSYQAWLTSSAQSALTQDIADAKANVANDLLGYTTAEVQGVILDPTNKTELDSDFNGSGKSYEQWLIDEARIKLDTATAAAEAAATLYGYTVTDVLNSQTRNRPASKDELDNFDGTNSYQAWLTIEAEALFNYNLNQAEAQAAKLGYTVTDILDGLNKPATKSELADFNGSGKTYQKWLTDEAAAKLDAAITLAESGDFNGYTAGDLLLRYSKEQPKTKTSLDTFVSGKSYAQWLIDSADKALSDDIAAVKSRVANDLLGYTVVDVQGGIADPVSKSEIEDNFNNSGLSYEAWLKAEALATLNNDVNEVETNIASHLLGYTVNDLLGSLSRPANHSELNDNFNQSGKSYHVWLEEQAVAKLAAAVAAASDEADLLGYTKSEIQGTISDPATLTELQSNYHSSGMSYKAWLEAHATIKLDNDIADVLNSVHDQLEGYTAEQLVSDRKLSFPQRKEQLTSFADSMTFGDWLVDQAQNKFDRDLEEILKEASMLGYSATDLYNRFGTSVPKNHNQLVDYDGNKTPFKDWLEKEAGVALRSDIYQAINNSDLLGYTIDELFNGTKLSLPTSKSAITTFTNEMSFSEWLNKRAKTVLDLDVKSAEAQANTLGYSPSELLGEISAPANKNELDNFLSTGMNYEEWLTAIAKEKLSTDTEAAINSANLRGYSVAEILEASEVVSPQNKLELDNFNESEKSFADWLTEHAEKILNAGIELAETTANLQGKAVEELLNGLPKPTTKEELETSFNNSGLSYKAWLEQAAIEAPTSLSIKDKLIIEIVVPVGFFLLVITSFGIYLVVKQPKFIKKIKVKN